MAYVPLEKPSTRYISMPYYDECPLVGHIVFGDKQYPIFQTPDGQYTDGVGYAEHPSAFVASKRASNDFARRWRANIKAVQDIGIAADQRRERDKWKYPGRVTPAPGY